MLLTCARELKLSETMRWKRYMKYLNPSPNTFRYGWKDEKLNHFLNHSCSFLIMLIINKNLKDHSEYT